MQYPDNFLDMQKKDTRFCEKLSAGKKEATKFHNAICAN
jgi:hypothetical protein